MRPTKLTAIFFAAAVTILATALVFSLINYSNSKQAPQKPSVPAAVEKSLPKPVQPAEPIAEKPDVVKVKPRQLSKTTPKADKAVKPSIPTKVVSAPKEAIPAELTTGISIESEFVPEAVAEEGQGSFYAGTGTGWYRELGHYDDLAMPPELKDIAMPDAAERKRHSLLFGGVEPYLRVDNRPQEAIERMNTELAEKLPEKYGKMVMELETLKEQEIAIRRTASQQM